MILKNHSQKSIDSSLGGYIVSAQGITVGFGERIILKDLSIHVRYGEIIGFVGASGTGKSLLLRAMLGLIQKQSGSIYFFGKNLDHLTEEQRMYINMRTGVLFQHGALFSSLTVLENVQVPIREYLNLSPQLMFELAMLKIQMVGLSKYDAQKLPSELSGGMIKRAALARALALDPNLLFLDEPTAGLDPIAAAEFDELILKLRETSSLTVYMVTHDLDTLFTACDHIAVLGEKRILLQGTLYDMLESENPWIKSYFRGKRARCIPLPKKG